jgi:hypothetical protein
MTKWTDEELNIEEYDKVQLRKIQNYIADMAEPSMEEEEYFIFSSEILNELFVKLVASMDEIIEKGNISSLVDTEGNISVKVIPQDLRYRRILES